MNLSTDSDCNRTMDPDMVTGSSLGLEVTMALVGCVIHSDWHDLAVLWLSDTHRAQGGGSDSRNPHDPFDNRSYEHQHKPWLLSPSAATWAWIFVAFYTVF